MWTALMSVMALGWGGLYEVHPNTTYPLSVHANSSVVVSELSENSDRAFQEAYRLVNFTDCAAVTNGAVIFSTDDVCWSVGGSVIYVVLTTGLTSFLAVFTDTDTDVVLGNLLPLQTYAESTTSSSSKPWGEAIAASIVVLMATFVGVVFVVPQIASFRDRNAALSDTVLFSFSSGAILATTFFMLLPESMHLVETEWSEETSFAWRWGTMMLLGVVSGSLIDLVVAFFNQAHARARAKAQLEWDPTVECQTCAEEHKGHVVEAPIHHGDTWIICAASVLIGDFMHNFVDGIFIGASFVSCGSSLGWTVTAATVYHELAQEMSDFFLLTKQCGFPVGRALFINFLSGTSTLLGVIVILASSVAEYQLGLILAFGAGVYVRLGAGESLSKAYLVATTPLLKGVGLLAFVVGAVCIGLVLLDHKHCGEE